MALKSGRVGIHPSLVDPITGMLLSSPSGASSMEDLTDVNISSPESGQTLIYDADSEKWVNEYSSIASTTLATLQDVDMSNVQDGQTLIYDADSEKWVNEYSSIAPTTLATLPDVDITSAQNKQVLQYNSSSEKWENENLPEDEGVPIGTIISFMGISAPQKYLACDGTAYNISAYPELASFIESQFSIKNYFGGDGTTTFAVPDLQGEFLRGTGTNSHTNQGSGTTVGTHQDASRTPIIYSTKASSGGSIAFRIQSGAGSGDSNIMLDTDSLINGTSNAINLTSTATESGASNKAYAVTQRPTSTSILYCIKAK